MKVDWALLASSALENAGTVSALGLGVDAFPSVRLPANPGQMPPFIGTPVRFTVVARLLLARVELTKTHQIELVVQDDDGAEVLKSGVQLPPLQPHPNLPTGWDQPVLPTFNVELGPKKFGFHSVELTIDGDHKKSIPFRILEQPAPPGFQMGPQPK